jgi:hypothetical protein
MRFSPLIALTLLFASLNNATAGPTELITNGGFETGTLAGWTEVNETFSSGNFFAATGTVSPVNALPTVGPASGNFYALTDQAGSGAHVLYQSFTVAPGSKVQVSFDLFANNWSGPEVLGPLDAFGNQQVEFATVDILKGGASPFDTGSGVLENLFTGANEQPTMPLPYTHYSFDITALVAAGGTFDLRFGEADDFGAFNLGIDNVSILASPAVVPEPASLTLAGVCLIALAFKKPRRHKHSCAGKQ